MQLHLKYDYNCNFRRTQSAILMPTPGPINPPDSLKKPGARRSWWDALDQHWQDALMTGFLGRSPGSPATDQDLLLIATTPTLRLVGPRGMYSNVSGPLQSLSPLAPLTHLQHLFVTFCEVESIAGIENLTALKSLFIHNNRITSLQPLNGLTHLEELYCQDNRIASLFPLQSCHRLKILHCQYNSLKNLRGLTRVHAQSMQRLICLPNEQLDMTEIARIEQEIGIRCQKE